MTKINLVSGPPCTSCKVPLLFSKWARKWFCNHPTCKLYLTDAKIQPPAPKDED